MSKTYFLLSLGCPKNEVDAEAMSGILSREGYLSLGNPDEAEFLIVNTCGFIVPAQEEAIAAILDLAEIKARNLEAGKPCYLIVTGCLSQRFPQEIYTDLPEVDALLGTAEYHKILETCEALSAGNHEKTLPQGRGSLRHLTELHKPVPNRAYAYLKISEGCSNACAFCAIPSIRGGQKSRKIEEIVAEAEYYISLGYKELILVAQDTTRYGSDIYGKNSLVDLLKALLAVKDMLPLRLMYVYGDAFTDELIDLIASEEKILPYIDLPVQHASRKILEAMRRRETRESISELISKLRSRIPGLILRSTVMVGFPGETEEDFAELLDFIKEIRFERLGAFIFSPEEGTLAYNMPEKVTAEVAQKRYDELMQVQNQISIEANLARVGETCRVVLEEVSEDGLYYLARSYAEAPEIDPQINLLAQNPDLSIGDITECKIIDADAYTLTAVSEE